MLREKKGAASADAIAGLGLCLGLAGIVVTLSAVTYLPFQDVPNHVLTLTMDRSMSFGETTEYLVKPDHVIFGYSLHVWISRLTAGILSASAVVKLLFILAALAIPLSAARLATALSFPAIWAAVLAMPLGLSWSMNMGFLPYVLGVPLAFLGVAATVDLCLKPSWLRALEACMWLTLTYLAHALAFGVGAVLAALAWVVYGRRSGRATLLLFLCFLPCTVFFFFDLVQDTFSPIAGTEVTLRRQPLTMLPIGTSAQRLFSTTYSLAGWRDWAAFLPFIGAILVGAAIGFWQSRPVVRRSSTFLIVAVLLVTIAFVALPDGVGLLNYLTQRIGIFSVGFLSLFAAWFWYSRESAWRALAVFLTLIAVASSLMDIGANARKVQEIAGPSLEGRLRGRYITAHIRRCEQGPQSPFGQYEPERHLWAYALGPGAVTPYLFSWNRYHPVQYRGEMYAKTLTAPDERINAADGDIGLDCAQSNQDRIHATCTCAGYDGSILVGEPATLEKEVGLSKVKVERRIAPGIVLARCEQERSRTIVEPGKLSSSHYLVRGWSTPETIDDRLAIWSVGRSSELAFRLVAADTPYQLSFVAKPYHRALPQTVSVKVNGSPIGKVELTYDWGRYMLPLDRALIRENVARLRFEYSQVNTPAEAEPGSHDVRELAVLFHRIEVEPIEGLSIASMPRSTTTPNITAASSTARSRTSM